ncbi:unnamed protein product [Rhizophagus irregularis]|nr:unnamed protein product [Rhizophagus irregularis]
MESTYKKHFESPKQACPHTYSWKRFGTNTSYYDVSSIPQYSYAYGVAMSFYEQHHVPRHTFIEDVTHNITNTPPSNQQSITSTISDNSYVSAV